MTVVYGEIYNDPAHVLSRKYDFVVIGGAYPTYASLRVNVTLIIYHGSNNHAISGGTAGNVVANRLTEDASVRVLVIEAGPS